MFSPRVTAMFKPAADQSFRVSYNKAFRSPSAINNFLDQKIFAASFDLRQLRGLIPLLVPGPTGAFLASLVPTTPISLIVNAVGNPNLKEESVTAYEASYTGTFKDKTTIGIAAYRNRTNNNINFVQVTPNASNPQGIAPYEAYTAANSDTCCAPTGIPGPLFSFLRGANIIPVLPRVASTYLNLGPLQQDGVELSLDHRFNTEWSLSTNYSYQAKPKVLTAKAGQIQYLTEELGLPSKNRFNASVNWSHTRFVGTAQVNYTDKALWTDVLASTYHGYTNAFTMVNGNFGVKWNKGRFVTSIKGTNLLDKKIQQHVFGDIIRRSVTLEARYTF